MLSQTTDKPSLISLEGCNSQPTSIRAKALVFADPASQLLKQQLEQLGPSEAPILIIGETGTGKELVARHLHYLSGRTGPFLAVNCGAISEQLAESELFGHEAGAFTGATARRAGWFEAADGGTLFLDEIGDLPLNLQVKLLRVLQEREVVRVGARKPVPVDIRLVAATNVDLHDAVSSGNFRLDLYYRLNIAQINLPPLRERIGDIPPLAEYFLALYSQRLKRPLPVINDDTLEALQRYPWPGNIRELENVIHYALLVSGGKQIRPNHLKLSGGLQADSRLGAAATPQVAIRGAFEQLFRQGEGELFNQIEATLVKEAFAYAKENQVRTAALLGISRNVMRTLLKKHGLLASGEADEGQEEGGELQAVYTY
ncbi:sigma-54 interaction domain-containing protein [Chitinimonas naiadis]